MQKLSGMCICAAMTSLLTVLVLLSTAHAGGSPRAHDGGFFLRLSAGGGGANTGADNIPVSQDEIADFDVSGTVGDLNIAIGAIVSENLALHGTLFGWTMSDPDLEIDGREVGELNADFTMSALGVGITYYLMPINIYLSPSIGFGVLSIDAGSVEGDSDAGLALDLSAGKEWWVGNSWGLGAALGATYHSAPDGDIDENWSGWSFAVRFTATFN